MTEPIRVLLVDDEMSFRRPITVRLRDQGFEEMPSWEDSLARYLVEKDYIKG